MAQVGGGGHETGGGGELRMPGTYLPGVIKAGSYYRYRDGRWSFWDVCDRRKAVVIELRDEPYARLVVEVEEPRAVVALAGLGVVPKFT
jgi:hypothetical protein